MKPTVTLRQRGFCFQPEAVPVAAHFVFLRADTYLHERARPPCEFDRRSVIVSCLLALTVSLACLPRSSAADLYVSSGITDDVLRYNGAAGTFVGQFVGPKSGGLDNPMGLTFGADGHLYVSCPFTHEVLRYDGDTGAFLGVFASGGGLDNPYGLTFGPDGNLYVSSLGTDQVLRYNGATGAYLGVFATGGGLEEPTGLTFGPDGNLYVCSSPSDFPPKNQTVMRYNGTTGALIGIFADVPDVYQYGPFDLTFGPDSSLYVSHPGTGEVLRYSGTTGAAMGVFVAKSANFTPMGLRFGPDLNLYVASFNEDAVHRFDGTTGALIGTFTSGGGLDGPTYLTFGSQETIPCATCIDVPGIPPQQEVLKIVKDGVEFHAAEYKHTPQQFFPLSVWDHSPPPGNEVWVPNSESGVYQHARILFPPATFGAGPTRVCVAATHYFNLQLAAYGDGPGGPLSTATHTAGQAVVQNLILPGNGGNIRFIEIIGAEIDIVDVCFDLAPL